MHSAARGAGLQAPRGRAEVQSAAAGDLLGAELLDGALGAEHAHAGLAAPPPPGRGAHTFDLATVKITWRTSAARRRSTWTRLPALDDVVADYAVRALTGSLVPL